MTTARIEQHPDLIGMRLRYERATEAPVAQLLAGLGFLAGIYLAISPWVVGFADLTALTASNLITGLALAALALGFAVAFGRTHGLAWVAPIIGAWTIVAPWVIAGNVDTTTTITNNVVIGAVGLLLGVSATAAAWYRTRR